MCILSGQQITHEVKVGRIHIEPFAEVNVNPNSYNLTLADRLLVYEKNYPLHDILREQWYGLPKIPRNEWIREPLDMKTEEKTVSLEISDSGIILWPGVLYLGCTVEVAGSAKFVPVIEGRSGPGRLGLQVHLTAGFGDVGFSTREHPRQWTLEMTVVHPLRVYAGVPICQIVFSTILHDSFILGPLRTYTGKYGKGEGPMASRIWQEFLEKP